MSESELKQAVREELEKSGDFSKMQAQMQAAVYRVLVKTSDTGGQLKSKTSQLDPVDALVCEYLTWRGCPHTRNLFKAECGKHIDTLPRRHELLEEFGITDSQESEQMPLLVGILEHFRSKINGI